MVHQSMRNGSRVADELCIMTVCNGVVKDVGLGLPDGHVRCPGSGNRQPYIDIATET
jgi:hypothetical protein